MEDIFIGYPARTGVIRPRPADSVPGASRRAGAEGKRGDGAAIVIATGEKPMLVGINRERYRPEFLKFQATVKPR